MHLACAVLRVLSSVPEHSKTTDRDIKKAYSLAMLRGEMNMIDFQRMLRTCPDV